MTETETLGWQHWKADISGMACSSSQGQGQELEMGVQGWGHWDDDILSMLCSSPWGQDQVLGLGMGRLGWRYLRHGEPQPYRIGLSAGDGDTAGMACTRP